MGMADVRAVDFSDQRSDLEKTMTKEMGVKGRIMILWKLLFRPDLRTAIITAGIFACQGMVQADVRPFRGFKALVVEPENSWTWDSAIFGALEERGFEVTFGRIPDDPALRRRYDLVALSIKRNLPATDVDNLEKYVADGGAVYGSWGGPMASPSFLRKVCKVGRTTSLRLRQIVVLESPLSKDIAEDKIILAERVGHSQAGSQGWEIVMVQPLDGGIPVAKDEAGNVLGVLSRHGEGRTAVLGFGPEKEKYFVRSELGPLMLDNLLAWLLEEKLTTGPQQWLGRVKVALPARAEVLEVHVNHQRITRELAGIRKESLNIFNRDFVSSLLGVKSPAECPQQVGWGFELLAQRLLIRDILFNQFSKRHSRPPMSKSATRRSCVRSTLA